MDFGNTVRQTVKQYMQVHKITASELARRVKRSPQYIHDILKGRKRWNEDTIQGICDALGLQIEIKPAINTIPTGTEGGNPHG